MSYTRPTLALVRVWLLDTVSRFDGGLCHLVGGDQTLGLFDEGGDGGGCHLGVPFACAILRRMPSINLVASMGSNSLTLLVAPLLTASVSLGNCSAHSAPVVQPVYRPHLNSAQSSPTAHPSPADRESNAAQPRRNGAVDYLQPDAFATRLIAAHLMTNSANSKSSRQSKTYCFDSRRTS